MSTPSKPDKTFWAQKSGLDLADECWRRVEAYYKGLPNSQMYQRWCSSYRMFYGLPGQEDPFDISKAGSAGEHGELTSIKVNHAGNLARYGISLISQTVPEFDPIPVNTDHESLEQVDWSRRALNYFMDRRGVASSLYDTATGGAIFGMTDLGIEWDPLGGTKLKQPAPMGPVPPGLIAGPSGLVDPAGNPIKDTRPVRRKTGDLVFRVYTPLDLVFNRYRYDQDHEWKITRRFVPRHDLAARYPTVANDILHFTPETLLGALSPTNRIEWERGQASELENDLIPLFTLFYKQTDAMPEGKIAIFLSKDIILYEGNLPYEDVPLVTISPGKILRSPYGEAPLHHVLGMQEVYDNVSSSVTTNNVACGTQIVMVPQECDYDIREALEGLAILRYSGGPNGTLKPEALNLTAPNGEALKYLQLIRSEMETVSGISSTLRGTPQPNVLSGSFGALLVSRALTYLNAFQQSYNAAVAKTGNLIVSILKQYADQPQMIEIVGKDRAYELKELSSEKFSNIHRVAVKTGNPATRTPEYNQAMADKLLERGLIKNPQDYITLCRTGLIDTLIAPDEQNLLRIRRENELLSSAQFGPDGKTVDPKYIPPCLVTDPHRTEILKHVNEVLNSPASRDKGAVVQATLIHVQTHINHLRTADPGLLTMIGETPLAPLPGMATTPPQQGPGPEGPPGTPPAPVPPQNGPLPQMPNQPALPENPLTGQQWTPQDGGIPPN